MSTQNIIKPMYKKIAIDIANRIASGYFAIGDRLYGRSSLASHYNVSPETIRKAVILLNDMNIVDVVKGSGITIKSVDNCLKFLEKFKEINTIDSLRKEISDMREKRNILEKKIEIKIDELLDCSGRLSNTNPLLPFEFKIYRGLSIIGKTISEINFWQHTNATIIAIKRGNRLIVSPGPYAVFKEGDIFIAVGKTGKDNSYSKVKEFVYNNIF